MSLTFSNISLSGGIEFRWPPQVAPTIGTAVALGATTANVGYTAAPGSLVYGTPYSVSFAGPSSGSKLTIPHTTALNIGSSSFTMEAWVYVSAWPATGDFNYVIAQKGLTTLSNLEWQFSLYRSGAGGGGTTSLCGVGIGYSTTNGTTITTTSAGFGTITAGAWHHVAVSKSSGSNARLYVDGTLAYEIEAPFNTNTGSTYIGYGYSSAGYNDSFNGYISNLRIVVGTALYPNNFTPSSASLTAVQNTQLLTCQSSTIVDNSTNQLSITATSATVSSTAPPITGPETTDILSHTAVSNPGGITATLNQATSGNITVTGLSLATSYTFTVYSTNSEGNSPSSASSNQITTASEIVGQQEYTTAGTYTWIVPAGVSSVSVVSVGGGGYANAGGGYIAGAGGGALAYKNNITVTPGDSFTVVVGAAGNAGNATIYGTEGGNSYFSSTSLCFAMGGQQSGGARATYTGDGGGNGGLGTTSTSNYGGDGGAGGYSGQGGDGGGNAQAAGYDGAGGGGGGGARGSAGGWGRAGGGVGIYGQGASGTGGTVGNVGNPGSGGSYTVYGGGGGGNANSANLELGKPGVGAVRIIYPGNTRYFPSTRTANE
jgi:hypothetical protein